MKNIKLTKLHNPVSLWSLILVILALLSGCNSVEENTKNTQADWSVTLTLSGGFAGLMRSITLDQGGLAVYSDKKTKSHIEKQVAIEDLQLYANLVKILPGRESTDTRSKQCRDCITYSLVVIHDGISKRRVTDDLSLQTSDANELITKMKALASELNKTR